MRFIIYLLLLFIITTSCAQNYGQMEFITHLPKTMDEVSGIQKISDDGLLWMINDAGNKDHLYGLNEKGKIIKDINIKGAKNIDWEDLTKDDEGNLYIGDFGNNSNERKDLSIYKIDKPDQIRDDEVNSSEIQFEYPQQKNLSSMKIKSNPNVEAFFFFDNYFYLFTKNHSANFDGQTFLYKIPAKKGKHVAKMISSFKTCTEETKDCQVTSVDISPNKEKIALLGHDRIWLFSNFNGEDFLSGKMKIILLDHSSQKEGLCFVDDYTLLITDEGKKNTGRNLYRLTLN